MIGTPVRPGIANRAAACRQCMTIGRSSSSRLGTDRGLPRTARTRRGEITTAKLGTTPSCRRFPDLFGEAKTMRPGRYPEDHPARAAGP
jgi:hypothetical protein